MKAPELNDFDAVCRYVTETMQASLWRMIVVPRQVPSLTEGGVMLDDESQDAELYNTSVGRIVSMGDLAWKANTKAHLDMQHDSRKPVEGDWVVFHNNASRRFELRGGSDNRIICFILQDTDVLAVTKEPERFLAYI